MSDVQVVLEQVREHYLSGYQRSIEDFSSRHQKSAPEILFELQGDESQPSVYRLYRVDMGSGDTSPPSLSEFSHPNHLNFEKIEFSADSISAVLYPIAWNGIEFETDPFPPSDQALSSWVSKWIDPDELGKPDQYGLGGYVHSVTYPEEVEGKMQFSVDFGSAPIDSVYDLFSVFIDLGVSKVEMHSNTVLNEN